MLLGVALIAAPIGTGDPRAAVVGEIALAVVAATALGLTLTLAPGALGVCLASLIAEYFLHQRTGGTSAAFTVLYASGLLSLGQLCDWIRSDSWSLRIERNVLLRRLVTLLAVAGGGAAVAALSLLAGGVTLGSALVAALVGSTGGCALLALVLVLQRQLDLSAAHAPPCRDGRGARADRSRLHREKSGG